MIRDPNPSSQVRKLHFGAPALASDRTAGRRWKAPIQFALVPASQISVLGHLARRGDVLVESGEWLGGPEFPAPIEGVEIRWPRKPDRLELEYSVTLRSNTLHKLHCNVNGFAGTRGRAAPIVGLTIALRGELADAYGIKADGFFLGEQMISKSGQMITLCGPTGREPLVGLRLWIETTPRLKKAGDAPAAGVAHGLRVFRDSVAVQR